MSDAAQTQGSWLSRDVEATVEAGRRLGAQLRSGDVVALVGQLGAGKTQMVRGLARGMGLDASEVSSPTFVLMQEYTAATSADTGDLALVHIDAYRLSGAAEFSAGLWGEDGTDVRSAAAVVIEWADVVEAALGDAALWLELEHHPEGRHLTWTCRGPWLDRAADIAACFAD